MKKFYKLVSTRETKNGWQIELDGKPVRTPGGGTLAAPTGKLADAVAAEWTAQGETIEPERMPLMQILSTACEQIPRDRAQMSEKLKSWIDTDLLCYRTGGSVRMAERQAAAWDPWLAWFEQRYGVALLTTAGLDALRQPAAAHEKLAAAIDAMDDMRFCAFQLITALCGSVVLGLAFMEGAASPDDVHAAAFTEENYKAEVYNEGVHGFAPHEERRRDAMRRDLDAARIFLDLL